jgi:hypothetical protein
MSEPIVPTLTDANRPFWDGCAAGELRLQQCASCDLIRYPISATCPRCLSSDAEWRAMSGRGEVLSAIAFHRAYNPAWADRVPYNVALIQLEEGPRLISNVLPLDRLRVPAGTPVRVAFDPAPDGLSIPRFEPADE